MFRSQFIKRMGGLVCLSLLCTLLPGGCRSKEYNSPRITLLRVGRLIDGSGGPVKGPSWVKAVDGVITNIAVDSPENRKKWEIEKKQATWVFNEPSSTLLPGFVAVFQNESSHLEHAHKNDGGLSATILNDLLSRGITTFIRIDDDLETSERILRYSNDAQRRSPRIALGTQLQLKGPTNTLKTQLREISTRAVEVVLFSAETPEDTNHFCLLLKEAKFFELKVALESKSNSIVPTDSCSQYLIVKQCISTENPPTQKEVCKDRKLMEPNSHTLLGRIPKKMISPTTHSQTFQEFVETAEGSLEHTILNLSSGPAHLVGYEDAIGKIQVGYRADFVLYRGTESLISSDIKMIQKVFVDGWPNRDSAVSWSAKLWYLKTVHLGL